MIACALFEGKSVCENGDYGGGEPELEEAIFRYTTDNVAVIKVICISYNTVLANTVLSGVCRQSFLHPDPAGQAHDLDTVYWQHRRAHRARSRIFISLSFRDFLPPCAAHFSFLEKKAEYGKYSDLVCP